VANLKLLTIGGGGGYGWYDPITQIPHLATENKTVAKLAAKHFLEKSFRIFPTTVLRQHGSTGGRKSVPKHFQIQVKRAGITCHTKIQPQSKTRKWSNLQRNLSE